MQLACVRHWRNSWDSYLELVKRKMESAALGRCGPKNDATFCLVLFRQHRGGEKGELAASPWRINALGVVCCCCTDSQVVDQRGP
jgi:hypothetical protein